MLYSRRDLDDVTWTDFVDRATPLLYATDTSDHNECLPSGVRVPRRARARLERDIGAGTTTRRTRLKH